MKNYEALDEFGYKWDDEDEYDKMWRVYGAPMETVERVAKQQGFLDKEKDRFIKQMEANKKEFFNEIQELETVSGGFKQFADIDNYEEIANNARQLHAQIADALDRSKAINNREGLVE
jgi:hypothetical protein